MELNIQLVPNIWGTSICLNSLSATASVQLVPKSRATENIYQKLPKSTWARTLWQAQTWWENNNCLKRFLGQQKLSSLFFQPYDLYKVIKVHFYSVFAMLLCFVGSITQDFWLNHKLDQAGWADSYLMGLVNQVVYLSSTRFSLSLFFLFASASCPQDYFVSFQNNPFSGGPGQWLLDDKRADQSSVPRFVQRRRR